MASETDDALRYTAAEAACISQAVASGVQIEWRHGDREATSDDVLRHARVGDHVGLVPQASGLVVLQLTLDEGGNSEAWRRHWSDMRDRYADHQHCMLFGPTLNAMQCWHRPTSAKKIADFVATEDAQHEGGHRFQQARLDIYATRPVTLWHPRSIWVELITKTMAPVERAVFKCKRGRST